jgi:hypothetical protein
VFSDFVKEFKKSFRGANTPEEIFYQYVDKERTTGRNIITGLGSIYLRVDSSVNTEARFLVMSTTEEEGHLRLMWISIPRSSRTLR